MSIRLCFFEVTFVVYIGDLYIVFGSSPPDRSFICTWDVRSCLHLAMLAFKSCHLSIAFKWSRWHPWDVLVMNWLVFGASPPDKGFIYALVKNSILYCFFRGLRLRLILGTLAFKSCHHFVACWNWKRDIQKDVSFSMVEVTGFEAKHIRFTRLHNVAGCQILSHSWCHDITQHFTDLHRNNELIMNQNKLKHR